MLVDEFVNLFDDWKVNDSFSTIDSSVSWLIGTIFVIVCPPSINPTISNFGTVASW